MKDPVHLQDFWSAMTHYRQMHGLTLLGYNDEGQRKRIVWYLKYLIILHTDQSYKTQDRSDENVAAGLSNQNSSLRVIDGEGEGGKGIMGMFSTTKKNTEILVKLLDYYAVDAETLFRKTIKMNLEKRKTSYHTSLNDMKEKQEKIN